MIASSNGGAMQRTAPPSTQKMSFIETLQSPSLIAQLKAALPRAGVTPERLARLAITQIRTVKGLAQCNQQSFLGAVMQCAQLGLEPGSLGQCWIIPYKGEATFILGYRGMCQLGYRSSLIKAITARAVFEGDLFDFDFGEDRITHKTCGEIDPAKLTHAWAAVHTTNGGRIWDVMTRKEIDRIRDGSASYQSQKNSPWKTDYAEMAKKTALRRAFKIAPQSTELQVAMQLDDAAEMGIGQGLEFDLPKEKDVTPPKDDGASKGASA